FGRSTDLRSRAADLSADPMTRQMADWVVQFEPQREHFVDERRGQVAEAAAAVNLPPEEGHTELARDAAAKAYLLAEDGEAFRAEPWVDDLVNESIQLADRYEAEEQWVRALRLYSSLGSVEPSNPVWKDRLKRSTRRIRLLALYAPDVLQEIQ